MKTITKMPTQRVTKNNTQLGDGADSKRSKRIIITLPNFAIARFHITGLTRLVVCRFSLKARQAIIDSQKAGKAGKSKRNIEKLDPETLFKAARYYSPKGWEGFNAAAVRNGMISACRLVNVKMTIAKLCIFCVEDGYDKYEPQFSLVRIYGEPVMQQDHVRNRNTGGYTIATRAAYHNWKAIIGIRWDADFFTETDISNIIARFGLQVGIGVGRPDSKDSNGMGWGTFSIDRRED